MEQPESSEQDEVFAFLVDPATHRVAAPVRRIDTHGAAVFLAGGHAYKVKRAVRFPFMDFSTLEKRRLACENEIRVNKPNAPDLYLGVVPISRHGDRLKLGPGPEIIEWAVHLVRFDETRTLDRLAERGALDLALTARLGGIVARAHREAPVVADGRTTNALRRQMDETLAALAGSPATFDPAATAILSSRMTAAFGRVEALLVAREKSGQARRCHGDLHLGNIVEIGLAPVLFDAIEFDDSFATSDVLYDFAFLLMDLWVRGLTRHANGVLNRYLWACHDIEAQLAGLAALPLFLALRAAIRARVIDLRGHKTDADIASVRRHFEGACHFLDDAPVDLVAIGGLSGTGKSTLAALLAPSIGRAPGAVHLRTDIERKRLHGAGELDRLPCEAYKPECTAEVYAHVRELAGVALEAGQSVVIDAVHLRESERTAAACVAEARGARFTGLWLEAPLDSLRARVSERSNDASDATDAIVLQQAGKPVGALTWTRLDASGPVEPLAGAALAAIRRCLNAPGGGSGTSA